MTVKAKEAAARAEADQAAAVAATEDQQVAAAVAAEPVLTEAPIAARSVTLTDSWTDGRDEIAAVDGAPSSQAAAAEVIAATVLPTPAPAASIGELAQTPAPPTSDTPTTTTDAPTPTTADTTNAAVPSDPATDASGRYWNPWVVGGLAVLAVGGVAAAVANNDDDDDAPVAAPPPGQPPAAPPPVVPPPAAPPPGTPPPAADPLAPTGFKASTATPGGAPVYFSDTNNDNVLQATEKVVLYNAATQHYYELVTNGGATPAPLGWDAALAGAAARGGHLFTGDAAGEIEFVRSNFAHAVGTPAPAHGGLAITESLGAEGAWIGLMATAGANPAVADGTWNWLTPQGNGGGPAFSATDPAWLRHFTFSNPSGDDNTGQLRAAMTGGNDLPADSTPGVAPDPAPTQALFDVQGTDPVPSRYIVEYETVAAVTTAPPVAVTIDEVVGGAAAPAAIDVAATLPSTDLASLIDNASNQA
jgi:hypothetical protein